MNLSFVADMLLQISERIKRRGEPVKGNYSILSGPRRLKLYIFYYLRNFKIDGDWITIWGTYLIY